MEHVIYSRPENERKGLPLVVLLHGYGASESDLAPLADQLPPEFLYASVRAPHPAMSGYCWYPLSTELQFPVRETAETIESVTGWLAGMRQDHPWILALGFSQGMSVATSVARRAPQLLAGVVGLSGFVLQVEPEQAETLKFDDDALSAHRLPIFWGRDPQDPVIPASSVNYTAEWLQRHANLTKVQYQGIWHGISAAEIAHVGQFLQMIGPKG